MHELSIVMSIIDIAADQVRQHDAERVEKIVLDIGQLSGIEPGALDFAWDSAIRNTVLENAERVINYLPARAECSGCGAVFDTAAVFQPCPHCGEVFNTLLQGKELRVKQLVLSG